MKKMFGYHKKKMQDSERTPGKPYNNMNPDSGKAKDNPPNYEGREHMRYKNPGYSKHEIDYPEDEPHMKSRVRREEMHEMEDNYHMAVPDQTEDTLPARIPRARMKMDAPDQEDPKPLMGNLVRNVREGVEDTSGEEEMGPNEMQENEGRSKGERKKMIVAVMKRKMKKG